jgi:hypothetical protein
MKWSICRMMMSLLKSALITFPIREWCRQIPTLRLWAANMQDVNWNDLRVFLAVATAGQIGRAAHALKVDPTTLGRRLRRLEQHLEVTLFERTQGTCCQRLADLSTAQKS